eukprot:m.195609 g.195609  ORF g.195609 m.195609 type:complete len:423 (+) comp19553_c0_seq1:366-1634(+)
MAERTSPAAAVVGTSSSPSTGKTGTITCTDVAALFRTLHSETTAADFAKTFADVVGATGGRQGEVAAIVEGILADAAVFRVEQLTANAQDRAWFATLLDRFAMVVGALRAPTFQRTWCMWYAVAFDTAFVRPEDDTTGADASDTVTTSTMPEEKLELERRHALATKSTQAPRNGAEQGNATGHSSHQGERASTNGTTPDTTGGAVHQASPTPTGSGSTNSQHPLDMQFQEIEHKFVVDDTDFDVTAFRTCIAALGPTRTTRVDVRDVYYTSSRHPRFVFRHRYDRELQQLTVKSLEPDPEVRLEVNLDLGQHKGDQQSAVEAFLATLDIDWRGEVAKQIEVYYFPDCEIVYYHGESASKSVTCVEFEAIKQENVASALAVLRKYELATSFGDRERTAKALVEILFPHIDWCGMTSPTAPNYP